MSEPRSPESDTPETAAYVPKEADPPTQNRAEDAATLPPSPNTSGAWPGGLPSELPAKLGRYELRKLLGKGGMGAVYLAQDLQLDRPIALKIPFFSPQESLGARERFFREARAAGVLSHPNLCPVYDVGEINGVHYLSMAYIEGQTLSEKLRQQPKMDQREAATLARSLALALQEAHDRGIIHRDLKPANIMMNQRGQPVIMDFGLARQTVSEEVSRLTKSGTILGTPAYMPPEQINSDFKAMGPGCDIYSLGIILYEMLTGKLPFEGPIGTLMAMILLDPPPLPSFARFDLDPTLEQICLKALAKKPGDRFLSMTEFARILTDYLDGKSVHFDMLSRPPRLSGAPMVLPVNDEPTTIIPPQSSAPTTQKTTKTGWGYGGYLMGCGILVVLCLGLIVGAIGLIAYMIVPDVKNFVEKQMQSFQSWEQAARNWQPPPADVKPEMLFPRQVQQFELLATEYVDGVDDLEIEKNGLQAVYRSPQGEVEIYAFRVNKNEKETLLASALSVIAPKERPEGSATKPSKTNHFHTVIGTPQNTRLTYSFGPPQQHGFFWWDKDWLFLVRSSTITSPEQFLKDFLAQPSQGPSGKPAATRAHSPRKKR